MFGWGAEADMIGEWRRLRNWLVNPATGEEAERQAFNKAGHMPSDVPRGARSAKVHPDCWATPLIATETL